MIRVDDGPIFKKSSRQKLLIYSLSAILFIAVFMLTSNSASAQYSDPSFILDSNCRTTEGPPNDYGVVHVNTNWRNSATFATGRAHNVSVRFNSQLPVTDNETRMGNTGGNGRTCWGGLRCDYVHTNDFNGTYSVVATSEPSNVPGGGSWTSASGKMRNDIPIEARLTYTFTPQEWNYIPNISPDPSPEPTIRHDGSYDIQGRVRNIGNGPGANFDFRISQRVGSGSWTNFYQEDMSGLSAGQLRTRTRQYNPPDNLPNGTRVCFRTGIRPYRGYSEPTITVTGSGWRISKTICLRVYTPPPAFSVSADCERIRITNLNMYNRDTTSVVISVGGEQVYSGSSLPSGNSVDYPRSQQLSTARTVTITITNDIVGSNNSTTISQTVGACYAGTCNVQGFLTSHPNNEVFVTEGYSTRTAYSNTGGLSWNSTYNVRAAFVVNPGSSPSPSPLTLASGSSVTRTFTGFLAGQTLDEHSVRMELQYQNSSGGWTAFRSCSNSFNPYTRFNLTPLITGESLSPSLENPSTYTLNSRVNVTTSPTVPSYPTINGPTATRTMTASGGASVIPPTHGPNTGFQGSNTYSDSGAVSGFELGTEFCGNIGLSYTTGWINNAGTIPAWTRTGSASEGSSCLRVEDRPYVSVFGADVIAAGDFGVDNCDTVIPPPADTGMIQAFFDSSSPTNRRGSGSQFAAVAVNTINEFSSAKMRAPTTETSFANQTPPYGGNYPGLHCITDYWSQIPESAQERPTLQAALAPGNLDGVTILSGAASYQTPSGGADIADGTNATIYVDGDVFIRRNIRFENESWSRIDDIPSFFLVVRGNLYIGAGVQQLDGVYVAQPRPDDSGGSIYTCATGMGMSNVVSPGNMANDCRQDLLVNGAFVAQDITFNRYGGSSLRYGSQGEFVYGPDQSCSSSGLVTNRPVCAAEVINFSPELYLVNPNLPAERGPGRGVYDSITNLTPIF